MLERLVIGMSLVWFPWSDYQSVLEQDTEAQTAPVVQLAAISSYFSLTLKKNTEQFQFKII